MNHEVIYNTNTLPPQTQALPYCTECGSTVPDGECFQIRVGKFELDFCRECYDERETRKQALEAAAGVTVIADPIQASGAPTIEYSDEEYTETATDLDPEIIPEGKDHPVHNGFTKIPRTLSEDRKLPDAELRLLGTFIYTAKRTKGDIFPSIPTLAQWAGMSVRTCKRAVAGLKKKKLLAVTRRYNGSSIYKLRLPAGSKEYSEVPNWVFSDRSISNSVFRTFVTLGSFSNRTILNPPTISELANRSGQSRNTIYKNVDILNEKGLSLVLRQAAPLDSSWQTVYKDLDNPIRQAYTPRPRRRSNIEKLQDYATEFAGWESSEFMANLGV
jgi:DNA-binding transcriptional regulator YhcF (GntR family)